jgi:hypothetical protein
LFAQLTLLPLLLRLQELDAMAADNPIGQFVWSLN